MPIHSDKERRACFSGTASCCGSGWWRSYSKWVVHINVGSQIDSVNVLRLFSNKKKSFLHPRQHSNVTKEILFCISSIFQPEWRWRSKCPPSPPTSLPSSISWRGNQEWRRYFRKSLDLKKGLKFSLSQLAAQLNQAAGTDPEKRKIADKVVLAIELIDKRK